MAHEKKPHDDKGKHKGQEKKLPDVETFDIGDTVPPPDDDGEGDDSGGHGGKLPG